MTRLIIFLTGLFAALTPFHWATADEFRPAYLHLEQVTAEEFNVLWRLPGLNETTTLGLRPVFPNGAEELSLKRSVYANGATAIRWSVLDPGGLDGKTNGFEGSAKSRLEILVRVQRMDGSEQVGRVLATSPGFVFEQNPGQFEVAWSYTIIGIEHILFGIDHLLFVLALLLIVRGTRRLFLTITSFTLAHSITLALATLGVVQVPGPPVEAIIALSIVFVAREVIHLRQGREGLAARRPWVVAFAFGLLHGLGFAGALAEVGLPQNAVPAALLFFNVGVELGQVMFVLALLGVAWVGKRLLQSSPIVRFAPLATTYVIGTVASYWVIERVSGF